MATFNRRNPAGSALAVTKSDSTVFQTCRAVYVAGGGDMNVVFQYLPDGTPNTSDTPVLFEDVPSGVILPIQIKMILSTSTVASGFVLLF